VADSRHPKGTTMHYYRRHIGDYAKRARRLNSPAQHGILLLLTDEYYDTEQPIPDATAHRIACCKREDVTAILEDFFVRDGEVWRCPEIDNVIEGYRSRAMINSNNGRNGGRPRTRPAPEEKQPKTEPKPKKS